MAKMTIQEKLEAALLANGGVKIPNPRTGKYVVIKTQNHPRKFLTEKEQFWFLGKAGALRVATTEAATKSIPAEKTKQWLLKWLEDNWQDKSRT